MKTLIAIAIVASVLYLANMIAKRYQDVEKDAGRWSPANNTTQPAATGPALPGMTVGLEATLTAARRQGAEGLKTFLTTYSHAIRDPRLAEIELDYVVLLSPTDPVEAKRIFAAIASRTPASSPVYERVKRLEGAFK